MYILEIRAVQYIILKCVLSFCHIDFNILLFMFYVVFVVNAKLQKIAGIINRNRNNSAFCTDNKRITLKISEIREMAI